MLGSKPINDIFLSGATLVEEEDFNELTAVSTTSAIVDAATTTSTTTIVIASNGKVSNIRQLPPLKLTASTTSRRRDHNNIHGSDSVDVDDSGDFDDDADDAYADHVAAANYDYNVEVAGNDAVAGTHDDEQQTATTASTTITKPDEEDATTTTITSDIEETTTAELNTLVDKTQQYATAATINPTTSTEIANNIPSTTNEYSTTVNESQQQSTYCNNATSAAISIVNPSILNPTAQPTPPTTTTTYTHNSKTTRSWPVIYRNPHHYDYEALYVQATSNQAQHQQSQQHQLQQTTYYAPTPSVSFKQNCYSNQFAQSILYSSSNEDLTAIDGCGESAASTAQTHTQTPATTTSTCQRNGGGGGNYVYGGYTNVNGYTNTSNNQQTTCYYFAPSRHNSIYEHPSAVVGSSLQFDPAAATTAAAAAAVESLRRSNSVLLRNSSCTKVSTLGTGAVDSPTSINSAMDSGSGQGGSTCCSNCCVGPPPVLFLFFTLLMTTSATAMLCAAIMTDHWEHVTWDRASLDRYTNRSSLRLEWMLQDKVAILKADKKDHRFPRESVFLVPMHGGIWTLCIDLPISELQELRRNPKFPRGAPPCVNYLAGSMENARGEEQRNDWQHSESQTTLQPHLRMQNLSISCSLVCLIILGSAALVGAFGVCQRQISAILITGVMYLLAALFALFTLMIIHFKRQQGRPMLDSDYDGTVDGIVARPGGVAIMAKPLLGARIFLTSWSLDLGWGGVVLCAITSVLWILLSKIMRYNPFSALMI